jgi:hypothetical protein
VAVDQVFVIECISDNVSTTTGATSDHSLSDDAGNTYTKIGEYTYSPTGAAADGITVSAWVTQVTTQLTTTSVITLTVSSSCNVKALAGAEFSIGAGNSISVGTPTTGNAGASTSGPSTSLSGLANAEHLFLAFVADEGPSTDTWTADAAFGVASSRGTSGGTADANGWAHMEQNIATATSMTHQSALNNARDWAEIFVIIDEVASGPTLVTISVSGSSTASVVKTGQLIKSLAQGSSFGAPLKQVGKPVSFSASSVMSVVKGVIKSALSATVGNAVSLAVSKLYMVAITLSNGSTASAVKTVEKPVSVSAGSTFSAPAKAVTKSVSFTGASSVSVIKRVSKTLTSSVGNAVTLAVSKLYMLAITLSNGSTASVQKSVQKPIAVSEPSSVSTKKDAAKTVSMSASTSTTVVKAVARALTFTGGSVVSVVKQVGKSMSATVGNLVTLTQGGPTTTLMELDFTVGTNLGLLIIPQILVNALLFSSAPQTVSVVRKISMTLSTVGSSLLSLLRGIYYPGSDPSNQAFAGRSVNDVSISEGANGVQFANTSQNNVLIQVSENSITITEG